jgi:RNA polymerase sigma factor (sigma-70 family)
MSRNPVVTQQTLNAESESLSEDAPEFIRGRMSQERMQDKIKFGIALKTTPKHGVVFRYMQDNNLSYIEMAEVIGISTATLSKILHFRWIPNRHNEVTAKKICDFFKCTIDEFLPPNITDALKNNETVRNLLQNDSIHYKEPDIDFLPFNQVNSLPELVYSEDLDTAIDREQIQRVLKTLTPKEEIVVKLRFWEDMTYDEIASELSLSAGRIQQILDKAFRKLKHPSRVHILSALLPPVTHFYQCAICDGDKFLKRELKFLYVPWDLCEKNSFLLDSMGKDASLVCQKCMKEYPEGIYADKFVPPGSKE